MPKKINIRCVCGALVPAVEFEVMRKVSHLSDKSSRSRFVVAGHIDVASGCEACGKSQGWLNQYVRGKHDDRGPSAEALKKRIEMMGNLIEQTVKQEAEK